jgi:hypothetical protein
MSEFIYILTSKTFGNIAGAYTDLIIATSVAKTNNCTIDKVRINGLFPGYLESVKQIFGEAAAKEVADKTIADAYTVTNVKR